MDRKFAIGNSHQHQGDHSLPCVDFYEIQYEDIYETCIQYSTEHKRNSFKSTMSCKQSMHMNTGEGEASYARNSHILVYILLKSLQETW